MLFFIISLYLIQYWEAVLSALRIRNTNSEGYVICPGLSVRKQQALDLNSFWLQILVLPLLHTHPFPPVKEPYTWSSASQWPHYFLQAWALLLLFLVGENVTDNTSARDWMYDMTLRPDWWARSPSPSFQPVSTSYPPESRQLLWWLQLEGLKWEWWHSALRKN